MPPPLLIHGDLLDQPVDVIVNAWNRNIIAWWLLLPQGVSGAIKRRAGLAPFRELPRAGPMPLGSAVLRSPGRGAPQAPAAPAGAIPPTPYYDPALNAWVIPAAPDAGGGANPSAQVPTPDGLQPAAPARHAALAVQRRR